MELTPQEKAVLKVFRQPTGVPVVRFQQLGSACLRNADRDTATHSLVKKGFITPLADGEYWLTEDGVQLLGLH